MLKHGVVAFASIVVEAVQVLVRCLFLVADVLHCQLNYLFCCYVHNASVLFAEGGQAPPSL